MIFSNDASPNAYEKMVIRLLANPAYGEKMAVHLAGCLSRYRFLVIEDDTRSHTMGLARLRLCAGYSTRTSLTISSLPGKLQEICCPTLR